MKSCAKADFFRWPVQVPTRVLSACCFPFGPEIVAGRDFRHRSIAIHQHFYHGRLWFEGGNVVVLRPGDVTFSLSNEATMGSGCSW